MTTHRSSCTLAARWLCAAAIAALAACTTAPQQKPTPALAHEQSRWVPVTWQDLPGWNEDRLAQAWPALMRSCQSAPPAWAAACSHAQQQPARTDAQARNWLMQNLQPYRVESLTGVTQGLMTGYYEPLVEARRTSGGAFRYALYAPPADLATRRPYWTRRELETLPAAQSMLRGREIAYVADPLDALVLHVQGSGRLHLTERDGSVHLARLVFAAQNGQPYSSVGRWLIDHGEVPAGQASWPAIRDWAHRHPDRVNELLWSNPRYVFFREEPLPDPAVGPRGAQGVPLTPGRSIAVDPRSVPYGTPAWIETTEPLTNRPLRRLVLAQDTGAAIAGAVRADYFWGWDGDAADQAGRMRSALKMWVLWPRP
ncbi:MAG TPA: MltA domain-containing protein [Steroidobacteraceae bacterium]|nr:MltA domain-containing protein [Steroidobacteraceae bacterium]